MSTTEGENQRENEAGGENKGGSYLYMREKWDNETEREKMKQGIREEIRKGEDEG